MAAALKLGVAVDLCTNYGEEYPDTALRKDAAYGPNLPLMDRPVAAVQPPRTGHRWDRAA